MTVPLTVHDLTILFDMRNTAPHNKHNDFYVIIDIHRRGASEIGSQVNQSPFNLT